MPQRIVVKVGTSTLTNAQGRIDRAFIADLTAQLAGLRAQGHDVVLVTSGAIRAGREAMGVGYAVLGVGKEEKEKRRKGEEENSSLIPGVHPQGRTHPSSLPYKQAAAAIGQGLLMHTYTEAFAWREVTVAQVLLTRDDLGDSARFANAQNTLCALLEMGVVPIINENDTVAVEEIKFGDNDTLAARVATLVNADLLLILSDVEGLYAEPPLNPQSGHSPAGKDTTLNPIPLIERIDTAIAALGGEATSGVGTGGMRTKIEAARIATQAGIRTVIARGRRERVIDDVVHGRNVGTTFLPCAAREKAPA